MFRTWGGFVLGFGVILAGYGAFLATGRPAWLRYGVALALVVSFGGFLVSNWMLRSDFLWPIAALFLMALGRPSASSSEKGPLTGHRRVDRDQGGLGGKAPE